MIWEMVEVLYQVNFVDFIPVNYGESFKIITYHKMLHFLKLLSPQVKEGVSLNLSNVSTRQDVIQYCETVKY